MPRRFAGVLLSLGALAWLPVRSAAQETPAVPSFVNDVEPIFTRFGCNQGSCHGKGAGQNGFRLSLRGFAPEWDHEWLTREFGSRRINRALPESSLLLRKPSGQAPHEGGKLLTPGDRAYQVLLDWIRAGAPAPRKEDPPLRRVTLLPGNRTLKPGDTVQLKVEAEFQGQAPREVTWLTQFVSNDESVAEVAPTGLVKLVRPGETAVRATYQGQVAVITVTAPHAAKVPAELFAKKNNFIDEHVFKKLADLRIEPAEPASDEVFLRRAFLDTIGVLPTPAEVRAFLADRNPTKRAALVDRLLERPEFIDFWALELGDLFQNRKESDHDVRGAKGVRLFHEWLRQQVAINRPWDELAREVLTASGSADEKPAVGYFVLTVGEQREAHRSAVVASAAQTFLGTRIGCAQCHNHPLEKYTQDDYYYFAGFFSRVSLDRKELKAGATMLNVAHPDKNQNKSPVGVVQPRTNQFLAPRPLDRSATPVRPGDDPRQTLAVWIVDPKNEYFAGAMVNRLWAHFLGVGLVEPIDDLRVSNPPTNPELYKALVAEFVAKKFDRKHLMRLILNSRTYQLSSTTKPGDERDNRFYSHYYARRLPAEVMLDAISQATGVPERFDGYPLGVRAVQVPDPSVKSYFLNLFGRSERITACACERNNDVTLPQILHLTAGETVNAKIASADGALARLLKQKKTDAELLDEVFLMAMGRLPTGKDRKVVNEALLQPGAQHDTVFRDVLWTLVNTKEFAFNH